MFAKHKQSLSVLCVLKPELFNEIFCRISFLERVLIRRAIQLATMHKYICHCLALTSLLFFLGGLWAFK